MPMQKPLSIILAALILGISLQMGLTGHFCGGELVQTKMILGYGTASCGMNCEVPSDNHQGTSFQKLSCCQDLIFTLSVDDYQSISQKGIFTVHQNIHPGIKYIFTPDLFIVNTYNSIPLPHITGVLLPFIQVFLI
jgi:hypothetical protein